MSTRTPWKDTLHTIIVGHETPAGRAFDVALILAILASVATVMADSVASIRASWGPQLTVLEWSFTALFTVEYLLRLACVPHPVRYASSFFGLVDLAAILPGYVALFIPGTHYLLVLRSLRVLRIFRVLKLAEYLEEVDVLLDALRESRRKIGVFIAAVLVLSVILGACMYVIEGDAAGFTSIPRSVYWTVVTITTVGYGDIAPRSTLGQGIASLIMLLGYALVAVPTGIVSAQLARPRRKVVTCAECGTPEGAADAGFCRRCGARLLPSLTARR